MHIAILVQETSVGQKTETILDIRRLRLVESEDMRQTEIEWADVIGTPLFHVLAHSLRHALRRQYKVIILWEAQLWKGGELPSGHIVHLFELVNPPNTPEEIRANALTDELKELIRIFRTTLREKSAT